MKFSVLMSLYHAAQPAFLRECLTSLQAQTRRADEIVMVFDGAISSELEQIVLDFQAALNIHIFRLPENVGLGKALNYGITHCSYEYIFRMDTDDVAMPNRFEAQCRYLETYPEIGLLGTQIAEFDHNPYHTQTSRNVPLNHHQIIEFSKKRNPFNHMTVAYQKSAVQQAGGYQHHVFMEDYNLWLRMLANGVHAANLPETLVLARTGMSMLERRRGWAYIRSEWQLYNLKKQLGITNIFISLYYFTIRSFVRLLPLSILKKLYISIRSPRKMKQITLNLRYSIIGLILTSIVLSLYLSQKDIHFTDIKIINSFSISYISYLLTTISLYKLRTFPGNQSWLHVLPTVGITYSIVFGIVGIFFVTFSNSFVFASGIFSALFFSFDFWRQQQNTPSIAYIPLGEAEQAAHLPNATWIKLAQPMLPATPIQAVVADLHSIELSKDWQKFLANCTLLQIPVYNIRQIEESLTGRVKIRHMHENDLGSLLPSPIYIVIKRWLDILLVCISLPITLPIMIFTAIIIYREDKGKILFTQKRIGQGGKEFTIYKFRSMVSDSEKDGAKFAQTNDERITKIGKFIRQTRIDELPQFFNILKGDMSLIGPRPEQKVFVEQFEQAIPFYNYRHIVKPGLSGWAQVTQGYASDTEETQVKIEYDFYYIKNFSFLLDLVTIAKTIRIIMTGFGAR